MGTGTPGSLSPPPSLWGVGSHKGLASGPPRSLVPGAQRRGVSLRLLRSQRSPSHWADQTVDRSCPGPHTEGGHGLSAILLTV